MASIEIRHPNNIFSGPEGGFAMLAIAVLGVAIIAAKGKPWWTRRK